MRATELAVVYLLIGTGTSIALVAHWSVFCGRAVDLPLLALFWPLYAPLVFMRRPTAVACGLDTPHQEIGALRNRVATRLEDIERLLARPEFSEADACARASELDRAGDERAAGAAAARLAGIRRLLKQRDRLRSELVHIDELLAQVAVQREVLRLAGAQDPGIDATVDELTGRVEALDAVLAADSVAFDELR